MAVALEQFVKQLEDSGIVSSGKLQNFLPPKAAPKDAQELAKELVKHKQLTKYQAGEIYQGRARSLILGSYTIMDKIGAGGMGQVFKAQHRRMDRVVAIKILPSAMTKDGAAVARFEREVRAAAKLSHPNIVVAHDSDESHGVYFLVMEHIEGADLSALVKKNGPFSVEKAVDYVLQAARGLEYAHTMHVIHRDIKPANLLLDPKGTVKFLDMGLARLEGSVGGDANTAADLTTSGTIMGTVDYMAPEQALNTKHADARSDIYSLGCTLHYLLTGKAPYDGETLMEKLLAHREQPIPSLGDVPHEVQTIFEKMVAKQVADRYRSMGEVVGDLQECRSHLNEPLSVQQPASSSSTSNSALTFLREISLSPRKATQLKKTHTKHAVPVNADKGRKKNRILIAAGSVAALVALLAVILIIRNRNVPERGQVALQPVANSGPPEPAKASFGAKQARAHQEAWAKYLGTQVERTNSLGMKMVLIPPGEFLMGSTNAQVEAAIKTAAERGDSDRSLELIRKNERPQHSVVLTKPLAMSATEVTIGQFRQFVEATKFATLAETFGDDSTWRAPGYAVTDESPVSLVTWSDAFAFCNWLCEQEKLQTSYRQDARDGWMLLAGATGYRLPTEAQWEYACRAGTTTQYAFGDDAAELIKYSWYKQNAGGLARAVALKLPNAFGLYDMHGNLVEACLDWMDDKWYAASPTSDPQGPPVAESRAIRGGSWFHSPSDCRCAFRNATGGPTSRYNSMGFRIVRTLEATPAASPVAPIEPIKPTPPADPNRAAAEWVLSVGGTVYVEGSLEPVRPGQKLPESKFIIREVMITTLGKKVPTGGLRALSALHGLRGLDARGTHIGDDGAAIIGKLHELERLDLNDTGITDNGVCCLKELSVLRWLHVDNNPSVTDAALIELKKLPITELGVAGCAITGRGIGIFPELTRLYADFRQHSSLPRLELLEFAFVGGDPLLARSACQHLAELKLPNLKECHVNAGAPAPFKDELKLLVAGYPNLKIEAPSLPSKKIFDSSIAMGDWDIAAETAGDIWPIFGGDLEFWHQAIPIWLYVGDTDSYALGCNEYFKRFANPPAKTWHGLWWAEFVGFSPNGALDWRAPLLMAQQFVVDPNEPQAARKTWGVCARGLIEYRKGSLDAAAKSLAGITNLDLPKRLQARVSAQLAMIEFRRGNVRAARAALSQARRMIEHDMPSGAPEEKVTLDERCTWLTSQILYREATTLLAGKKESQ